MTVILPILTEEEIRRAIPPDEEARFGSLATARGHLPLKAMDITARIDGLLSEMCLSQTFVNTLHEPLEATYIFPLPDRAAVTRFRIEAAGRVIEGVLKERGEARREYDQAIQAGHRAAITEQERQGVFTMRVGNVMPGEEATVRLNLVSPLPYCDGEVTFRFPLVVAPRYIPGNPLSGPSVGDGTVPDTDAVPDASRITPPVLLPGYPNPVRLSLTVDVHPAGLPLGDFRSSLHAVLTKKRGDVRQIRLQPGERLDRDFLLRFRLGDGAIQTALALTPDQDGKKGTFALTVVPPSGQASSPQPRDVVFVLDRSGSMNGWKLIAARRALARMVDTLADRDRFSVLAFDNAIETVPEFRDVGLVAATNRNRFRAVEFLAKIEARGGTEMAQPLDLGVRQLTAGEGERERILVLVTDGQVGNEDQILRSLASRVRNLRIFILGIDQAVNESFLRRLATLGGGACEFVESEDRLDEVMDQVHRRIGTATLTRLRIEPAGLHFDPDTTTPTRLPDLFVGAPLCIMGRYWGNAKGSVALQAADADGKPWIQTIEGKTSANPAFSALWARGHIHDLEDRFVIGHPELEKRIVETSLQFGVLCRFTAFVAVDRSEVVNTGRQRHKIMQPVEMPSGWELSHPHPVRTEAHAMLGAVDYMAPEQSILGILRADTTMTQRMDQRMILAPRMIQSMEILQLPITALQERIHQELQENPVLELKEVSDEEQTTKEKASPTATESEDATNNDQLTFLNCTQEQLELMHRPSRPRSLQDYLNDQLTFLDYTQEQLELMHFLITYINDNGHLTVSTEEIAKSYHHPVSVAQVEEVLRMVQKLEPPGVGARNDKECLLLQLTPEIPHREVLRVLISNHLEDIAHNRLPIIQRRTGFDLATIKEAIEVLRHLTPWPGAQFTHENFPYVVPDIAVKKTKNGDYEVRLLDDWTPGIYISRRYLELYRDKSADPKAKEYLKRKIQAAQSLMESIEQRRNILEKVTKVILQHQRAFLDRGPEFIQPLKMQQIADEVGAHVTTVSRAVDGKWVLTPRGIFPLKRFFERGTYTASWETIKQKLLEIIEKEDKSNPLSDQDLVTKLHESGYPVARSPGGVSLLLG